MIIPSYSIRFYIRINKKQRGDTLTPLRLKVWVAATKSYLYSTTTIKVTPNQWKHFNPKGMSSITADPAIAREVYAYLAVAQLVVSATIVNNRIMTLTSDEFSLLVNKIVSKKFGFNRSL
jgi:hypothetical protein